MKRPSADRNTSWEWANETNRTEKRTGEPGPLSRYGPVEMPPDAPPMLLLADTAGSWIVSRGRGGTDMRRLWRARVD